MQEVSYSAAELSSKADQLDALYPDDPTVSSAAAAASSTEVQGPSAQEESTDTSAASDSSESSGSIIVADCDHGVQCIIQLILAVFGGKTVIILIYSTHDIELDQAGSLHLLIVDGTFGIFCKIAYIYGPGSVIGGKK